ncbi:hypothetical protein KAR91_25785 [Candidatus Pacearchaeota archaeon]|nr:hypothetical protein [Candidatus Pacearchaeota archaeon]
MREIKFRVFGYSTIGRIGKKEMQQWKQIKECFDVWLDDNDATIMQFTGLKDKNGKEIYEGDTIGFGHFLYRVKFKNGAFIVCDLKYNNPSILLSEMIRKRNIAKTGIEVVGNIHENPELLKK